MFSERTISKQNNDIKKENNVTINKLVPLILKKSASHTNIIKKRMKVRSIFSEFEDKANRYFNIFIRESNKRYKHAKSGIKLDTILKASQPSQYIFSTKILKDKLFKKEDFNEEKELMKEKSSKYIFEEVNDLFQKVKECTNDTLNNSNSNKSMIRNETILTPKLNSNRNEINLSNIKNNHFYSPQNIFTTQQRIDFYGNNLYMSRKKLQNDKQIVQKYIDEDNELFKNRIKLYQNHLSNLKEDISESNAEKFKYNIRKIDFEKNLKLLDYQKVVSKNINGNQNNDIKRRTINIHKLIKYSKKFKHKQIQNVDEESSESEETERNNENENNDIDYNDILQLVKKEANNNLYINNKFKNKQQLFDRSLNNNNIDNPLPKLEEYEQIISRKFALHKRKERLRKKQKTVSMDDAFMSPEDMIRRKIQKQRANLKYLNNNNNLFITGKKI
jgi:hypothetical protein